VTAFNLRADVLVLVALVAAPAPAAAPLRLTTDGRVKSDPIFIKGGTEIVYTVLDSAVQQSLMRLKLPGGVPERLHPDALSSEFEATFSADGRWYAFIQSRGNLNLKLVIKDTKTNKESIYDPGGGFASLRRPTFAPDGSRIVFTLPAGNGQVLTSVNNEGKDKRDLIQSGLNSWAAFSPDGKQLAFSSSRDGDYEIYVMDTAGGQPHRLTKSPGLDLRPTWSPDGKRLAFTSNRTGRYQVHIMNSDGAGVLPLDGPSDRDDYPAWHPDGKRLVIVRERDGKSDLYLLDVPGR
jgi:TolB protein